MTWVTPPTFVNGNPLPDTDLNKLSDNLDHLGSMTIAGTPLSGLSASSELIQFLGVQVYNSANIAIGASATVVLGFDSEQLDTDSFHDNVSNNSRLTIPATGIYFVFWKVLALNLGSALIVNLLKNGTVLEIVGESQSNAIGTAVYRSLVSGGLALSLAAGDYLELQGVDSGSGSTVVGGVTKTKFGMYFLGV